MVARSARASAPSSNRPRSRWLRRGTCSIELLLPAILNCSSRRRRYVHRASARAGCMGAGRPRGPGLAGPGQSATPGAPAAGIPAPDELSAQPERSDPWSSEQRREENNEHSSSNPNGQRCPWSRLLGRHLAAPSIWTLLLVRRGQHGNSGRSSAELPQMSCRARHGRVFLYPPGGDPQVLPRRSAHIGEHQLRPTACAQAVARVRRWSRQVRGLSRTPSRSCSTPNPTAPPACWSTTCVARQRISFETIDGDRRGDAPNHGSVIVGVGMPSPSSRLRSASMAHARPDVAYRCEHQLSTPRW